MTKPPHGATYIGLKVCPKCGGVERFEATRRCVTCLQNNYARWKERNPNKGYETPADRTVYQRNYYLTVTKAKRRKKKEP